MDGTTSRVGIGRGKAADNLTPSVGANCLFTVMVMNVAARPGSTSATTDGFSVGAPARECGPATSSLSRDGGAAAG